MKRYVSGVYRLVRQTRTNSVADVLSVGTSGTWMRVYWKINGKTHSLWRAVDQDGNVLDILVQSRRNTQAAKRFFRKLRVRQKSRSARDYYG
jgi:transposase-like protein